jgi:transcriptional regulator with XRE-family HTH domain
MNAPSPLQKLGRRIQTLREAAGLGVEALQAAAEVEGLVAIEAGQRDPDYAALVRLARALGCGVAALLGAMEG